MKAMMKLILWCVVAMTVTGCLYQMPDEEEVDLKPTTNNPNVIHAHQQSALPGIAG